MSEGSCSLASPRICWSKEFPVAPGLGGGACNRPQLAETEKATAGSSPRGVVSGLCSLHGGQWEGWDLGKSHVPSCTVSPRASTPKRMRAPGLGGGDPAEEGTTEWGSPRSERGGQCPVLWELSLRAEYES